MNASFVFRYAKMMLLVDLEQLWEACGPIALEFL
jgi:hypothetical protein